MNSEPTNRPDEYAAAVFEEMDRDQSPAEWWNERLDGWDAGREREALESLVRAGCKPAELLELLRAIYFNDGPRYSSTALTDDIEALGPALKAVDRLMFARVGVPMLDEFIQIYSGLHRVIPALQSQQQKLKRKPDLISGERLDELLVYIGRRTKTFNAEATANLLGVALTKRPQPSALKTRLSRLQKQKGYQKPLRVAAPKRVKERGRARKVKQFEDRTKHFTGNKHIFQTRLGGIP